nr:beta-glucuronidase [Streptococcus sp. S784/96/1]
MMEIIALKPDSLKKLRDINPLLVSYNVEFAEVTGGTFWKAYSDKQISGEEEFYVEPSEDGIAAMYKDLMQVYSPINLYDEKLRYLSKELGQAWVRVSGTWSTKTYYDFEGQYQGEVPKGYLNVLTKEQWIGVLDFVKSINGRLMISMANCPGVHSTEEPWHPAEAEKIFSLSQSYGVPIEAVEFANEPNMLEDTGFPEGYTAEHYRRDQDIFFSWLDVNYPDCLKVGPSTTGGDNVVFGKKDEQGAGGIEQVARQIVNCSDLMEGTQVPLDIFSYHYYNGVSERLASVIPSGHWSPEEALTEDYLEVASDFCRTYLPLRDRYVPNAEMWVTESGDAGGGGNTWASTFLDVFRTLNELGSFATLANGVIFHNTLASSDYGYLAREVFDPRPNYFAVLLWNRLMGTEVFDSGFKIQEGAHVFAHSRKDGRQGKAYLIVNNSEVNDTVIKLDKEAELYLLEGENKDKRARRMTLNGKVLELTSENQLPEIVANKVEAGEIVIPKTSCAFIIL